MIARPGATIISMSMQMIEIALVSAVAASLTIACGPTTKSSTTPGKPEMKAKKDLAITEAALPYKILARDGAEVDEPAFLNAMRGSRAVCLGESHNNPHHHWVQLHLFDKLSDPTSGNTVAMALGMEMFQRPFQAILDDYASGKIDDAALLSRSDYEGRWGFDWGFYSPTIRMAIDRKATLLALNTERELTKKVSRKGIPQLSEIDRAKLPEMNVEDPVHRAWWDSMMGGSSHIPKEEKSGTDAHGNGDPHGEAVESVGEVIGKAASDQAEGADGIGLVARPNERSEWIYTAQVLWDETMSDGAAKWLSAGGNRQVVILAGSGHCHDSGIVNRLKRRGVAETISVRPVIDKGDGELAGILAEPQNDYIFVMTLPK